MHAILLSLCVAFPTSFHLSKKQTRNVCKYEPAIIQEATKNGIEPELLASVIYVESGFYPRAVSRANACGLTQVVPKWTGGRETRYRKYSCRQLKRPKTSIKLGARILAYMINHYANGNEDKALCMYNAGSVCLRKKGLYKRSRYVKKVRKVYNAITTNNQYFTCSMF